MLATYAFFPTSSRSPLLQYRLALFGKLTLARLHENLILLQLAFNLYVTWHSIFGEYLKTHVHEIQIHTMKESRQLFGIA